MTSSRALATAALGATEQQQHGTAAGAARPARVEALDTAASS